MPAINDIYLEAKRKCDDSRNLVSDANSLLNGQAQGNEVVFQQSHYNVLIEHAYMNMFEAFESFMEQLFIAYMMGYPGRNGQSVTRYVSPIDEQHAESMLRGNEKYMDFTSRETIQRIANNYFQDGGPFVYLSNISADFETMKKIRNELSHHSLKSRRDFESAVRSNVGQMPTNLSVSWFLMTNVPRTHDTFFTKYYTTVTTAMDDMSKPSVT